MLQRRAQHAARPIHTKFCYAKAKEISGPASKLCAHLQSKWPVSTGAALRAICARARTAKAMCLALQSTCKTLQSTQASHQQNTCHHAPHKHAMSCTARLYTTCCTGMHRELRACSSRVVDTAQRSHELCIVLSRAAYALTTSSLQLYIVVTKPPAAIVHTDPGETQPPHHGA